MAKISELLAFLTRAVVTGILLVITLVIVGKKSESLEGLSDAQKDAEKERPARRDLTAIHSIDRYDPRLD